MMEDRLTKKELKALRKLERLENSSNQSHANTIKWLVIGIVSVLFLGFFTYIIASSKQEAAKTVTDVTRGGQSKGPQNAKAVLVEFGDFQCPACKASEPDVLKAFSEYPDKLRVVFKHFPLTTVHQNAMNGSKAAEAAAQQGKFWEMHDILYEKQEEWANLANPYETFLSYAKVLQLDEKKFEKDYNSSETTKTINDQENEGVKNGVNSTPSFFLNNKRVEYEGKYENLKKAIEEAIKAK